jgi:hypothetical protein
MKLKEENTRRPRIRWCSKLQKASYRTQKETVANTDNEQFWEQ